MDSIIYADVLFIVNFSMDFLSLLLASKLSRNRAGVLGLVFASCIGAGYGVAATVFPGNKYIAQIINAAVALLMCYVAFDLKGAAAYLRVTALFYGIGFLLGGAMTALYSFLSSRFAPRNAVLDGEGTLIYTNIPLRYFALLALIAGGVSFLWELCLRHRKAKSAPITVTLGERQSRGEALCDSGNLLCELISGLPVVLLSPMMASEVMSEAGFAAAISEDVFDAMGEVQEKLRIIPASGIGGDEMLIGFIPDSLTVDGERKCACAAICKNLKDGYDAILPAELV